MFPMMNYAVIVAYQRCGTNGFQKILHLKMWKVDWRLYYNKYNMFIVKLAPLKLE